MNSNIGIISDIHGNYPALYEVIQKLKHMNCVQIICLGDIAGYYPMINECVDLLIKEKVFCIKGNHDSYLVGESQCPRSHSVMNCINYQRKIIKPSYIDWIRSLTPLYEHNEFVAMHGGLNNFLDEYVDVFDFQMAHQLYPEKKVFFSGHTHIQKVQYNNGVKYCNPGSVGQPRDHDSRAAYAILNNYEISIHRTEYPINVIAGHMRIAGFDEYYYRNLYYGCKIGEKLK